MSKGKSKEEINKLLQIERERQAEYYAYMIIHNDQTTKKKKKERIFQLPSDHVEQLYKQQQMLKRKESIYRWKEKILGK